MQRQKAAKEAKAAQNEGGASKHGEDEEMGGGRGGGRRNRRRSSPEPDGAALANEKDPLAQAHVWVTELVDAHTNVDTLRSAVTAEQFVNVFLAQVEVSLLRGKFLLALQGLNRARAHVSNARLSARIHVWHVRLLAA